MERLGTILAEFLVGKYFSEARDAMTNSELRADIHSIEPIPDADRDSTGPQQMWIWAGANIAPVNWALGALGIILKLGLWETIAVIVVATCSGAPSSPPSRSWATRPPSTRWCSPARH